jgi:hypothetical protein
MIISIIFILIQLVHIRLLLHLVYVYYVLFDDTVRYSECMESNGRMISERELENLSKEATVT